MSRIMGVVPKDNYRLEVFLDNGSSVVLNLEGKLETVRFGILSDVDFFKKAAADGSCISWEGKVELSLSEILQLVQK
ncbi:MAG TPA: hypothetical protein VN549_07405 [Negativicutes bacterium]|nr:hypothetical protein [Negativicutes bacterium]